MCERERKTDIKKGKREREKDRYKEVKERERKTIITKGQRERERERQI